MALSNPTSHFLVWMKEAKQKQNLSRRGAARRQKMGESDSGGGGVFMVVVVVVGGRSWKGFVYHNYPVK